MFLSSYLGNFCDILFIGSGAMKRAIVLSGGGSKGAYQIGVWKALRKLKIDYDIVTGTSIGSVNGIMMVQKEYHKAAFLWKNIGFDDIFDVTFPKDCNLLEVYKKYAKEFLKNGGMETSKIYEFINNSYDEKKFYKSPIDYGIITYNVSKMEPKAVTKKNNKKNLIKYVLASSTCFPAFQITQIDDTHFVDGGYYDNLPINLAVDLGADEIIAVDLGAVGIKQKPNNEKVSIKYITPRNDLGSFLVFDKKLSRKAIKYGYNDTMKVYKKLDGNKFTYKKGNLFENYTRYNVKFVANIKKFLATRSLDKTIIDEIIYPQSLNKFLNTKDYKFISDTMNKVLEYAGELLKLDDSIIYSINYYNVLLKREIDKYQAFSRSYIKNMILHKKGRKTHNRRAIVKYFYDAFNKHNATKLEIISLAIIFPKEFLTAIYIYTI